MNKLLWILACITFIYAGEPISPIPLHHGADIKKAKLGKELFFDTILSKDNTISCLSCHDLSNGGSDSRTVSSGFSGREGNIQSLTVFNAKYNFKQFWNGRAANLLEQAKEPLNNPAEHNMNPQALEEKLNNSSYYKSRFKKVYSIDTIAYAYILDAIVEFEKALTTPNSKFDKYLREEEELSEEEKEGYTLFKQNGCITCHNGINIGGNSFQKMGTFLEYKSQQEYPDRYDVTGKKAHRNVFKVPTLRNIALTAPYFHDGSAKNLQEAVKSMSQYNLGLILSDEETKKIVSFLNTLTGEMPKILEP
ncbi:c-type cytochrome [bacterium]|nr:c-type cytochrome [bacterium]MBU1990316.1 c-type cytochrome [bacterium]